VDEHQAEEIARDPTAPMLPLAMDAAVVRFRRLVAEAIEAERQVYLNSDEVLSKPEAAREKIVDGMLGKRFFAENVLAEQAWIHEPKKTVAQALEEEGLTVLEFERYALAE